MARLVISDASPLIGLSRVEGLHWLQKLFGTVWIPRQIESEILSDCKTVDEIALRQALEREWLKTWPETIELSGRFDLDEGESACIELAIAHPGSLLLIDERAGRAQARECEIAVAGTAAVIGLARIQKLIPSARAVFEHLHQSDFRIAPEIILTVLARVGEGREP